MVVLMADGATSRGVGAEAIAVRRLQCHAALKELGVEQSAFGDWPDNRMDRSPRLEIIKDVEGSIEIFCPSIVYTHHGSDCNIDHRVVNDAVVVACRPRPGFPVKRLLFFEVPSSTEWSLGREPFQPNYFMDISETLDTKLLALSRYESEVRDFPHPRSHEAIASMARWRGAAIGVESAEAFVLARQIC